MDRRRAAWALLALAASIAGAGAAPTASNQTALDLYDEHKEGCYYNFQHYGEGDRIMTNEPCLNCTCHNRMLMCYLRVCPFTKAIGQDCTVEKRADQCCPIVTCPDVPVDLLTSTSTTSPAEYGGTGVGKVDNYGCTVNGKYLPEGAKVPQTPGKPCEHCYCIRNMTTCVMQECTLHVDGCTPIYHKDVCCPVRYFCDHPDEEMPMLDDMTTTVRPTPGFLLTTTTTEAPVTEPAKRECVENDQLYPDGALIKTEKPCVHCYCMKGDIVCVVQECGTPMENEGKNCTSMPPRDGQCCPDTYICEGDEPTTEIVSEIPYEASSTLIPPRRVMVEGSGYRNEPDFTEIPTFATELEGSGEDQEQYKPVEPSTTEKQPKGELGSKFGETEENVKKEAKPTEASVAEPDTTTEPDKGMNTVPSSEDEMASDQEKTTLRNEVKVTEPTSLPESTEPAPQTAAETVKPTESEFTFEQTTIASEPVSATSQPTTIGSEIVTAPSSEPYEPIDTESKVTEPPSSEEITTIAKEEAYVPTTESSDQLRTTAPSIDVKQTSIVDEEGSEPSMPEATTMISLAPDAATEVVEQQTTTQSKLLETTAVPIAAEPESTVVTLSAQEEITMAPRLDETTPIHKTTDASGLNTIPIEEETLKPMDVTTEQSYVKEELTTVSTDEEISTPISNEQATTGYEIKPTKPSDTTESKVPEQSSKPTEDEKLTTTYEAQPTEPSHTTENKVPEESSQPAEDENLTTIYEAQPTEPSHTTESKVSDESSKPSEDDKLTTSYEAKPTEPSYTSDSKIPEETSKPTDEEKLTTSHEATTSQPSYTTESKIPEATSKPIDEEKPTSSYDTKPTESITTTTPTEIQEESSQPSVDDKLTTSYDAKPTEHAVGTTLSSQPEENIQSTEDKKLTTIAEAKPTTYEPVTTESSADQENKITAAEIQTPDQGTESPSIATPSEESETQAPKVQMPEQTEAITSEEPATEYFTTSSTSLPSVLTESIDKLETTTINANDNEIIDEVTHIPGRIPGEGYCLLNGITYRNESVIPSTNKCHTGCRCISSIVKCDPILCSPPPEYMNNCQPMYDTPDSCCPTYVCDHTMETAPPKPHSQMSGTESPTSTPSVECSGDECKSSEGEKPDTETLATSQQPETSDCGFEGCDKTTMQPPSKVELENQPAACEDPEKCKEVKVPEAVTTCEGESCTGSESHIRPCAGGECETKTESSPSCEGDDCKTATEPTKLCAGEQCEQKQESGVPSATEVSVTCEGDDCKAATEASIPFATEDGASCEGDQCKTATEAGAPSATEAGASSATEAGAPSATEASAPSATEASAPSATETGAPSATETGAPSATEASAPSATEASAPSATEASAPSATETGAPSATEASAPSATEASAPSATDASAPCEGDQCKTASEASAPSATEAGAPSATEASAPSATETSAPSATEASAPCEGDQCKTATEVSAPYEAGAPSTTEASAPCEGDQCKNASEASASSATEAGASSATEASAPCEGDQCKTATETSAPCEGDQCKNASEASASSATEAGASSATEASAPCEGDQCKTATETSAPCEGNQCKTSTEASAPSATEASAPTATEASAPSATEAGAPCEGDDCKAATEASILFATEDGASCEGEQCKTATEAGAPSATEAGAPSATEASAPSATEVGAPSATEASAPSATEAGAPSATEASAPCEGDDCKAATEASAPSATEASAPCEGDDCKAATEASIPFATEDGASCEGDQCKTATEASAPSATETGTPSSTKAGAPSATEAGVSSATEASAPCEGEECKTATEVNVPSATEVNVPSATEASAPCEGDQCKTATEASVPSATEVNVPSATEASAPCEGDQCKTATEASVPCEGDQCKTATEIAVQCEGENCETRTEPSVPCEGDKCDTKTEASKPATEPSVLCEGEHCETKTEASVPCKGEECKTKEEPAPCVGDQCETKIESSVPCEGEKCETKTEPSPVDTKIGSSISCAGEHCDTTIEPIIPKVCANEEECKRVVPGISESGVPCEGNKCEITTESAVKATESSQTLCEGADCKDNPDQTEPCEGENCPVKPVLSTETTPECQGDACTSVPSKPKQDCDGGECITDTATTTVTDKKDEECSEESGCRKPDDLLSECLGQNCRRVEGTECTGPECVQETVAMSNEQLTTPEPKPVQPVTEQTSETESVTEQKLMTPEPGMATEKPESMTTLPEDQTTKSEQKPEVQSVSAETTESPTTSASELTTGQPAESVMEEKSPEVPSETTTKQYDVEANAIPEITTEQANDIPTYVTETSPEFKPVHKDDTLTTLPEDSETSTEQQTKVTQQTDLVEESKITKAQDTSIQALSTPEPSITEQSTYEAAEDVTKKPEDFDSPEIATTEKPLEQEQTTQAKQESTSQTDSSQEQQTESPTDYSTSPIEIITEKTYQTTKQSVQEKTTTTRDEKDETATKLSEAQSPLVTELELQTENAFVSAVTEIETQAPEIFEFTTKMPEEIEPSSATTSKSEKTETNAPKTELGEQHTEMPTTVPEKVFTEVPHSLVTGIMEESSEKATQMPESPTTPAADAQAEQKITTEKTEDETVTKQDEKATTVHEYVTQSSSPEPVSTMEEETSSKTPDVSMPVTDQESPTTEHVKDTGKPATEENVTDASEAPVTKPTLRDDEGLATGVPELTTSAPEYYEPTEITKQSESSTTLPEDKEIEPQGVTSEPFIVDQDITTVSEIDTVTKKQPQTEADKPQAASTPIPQKESAETEQPILVTVQQEDIATAPSKVPYDEQQTDLPVVVVQDDDDSSKQPKPMTEKQPSVSSDFTTQPPSLFTSEVMTKLPEALSTESSPEVSETTPYLVILEEHTHKDDEIMTTVMPLEEITTHQPDAHVTEQQATVEVQTDIPVKQTESSYVEQDKTTILDVEPSAPIQTTPAIKEEPSDKVTEEMPTDSSPDTFVNKYGPDAEQDVETTSIIPVEHETEPEKKIQESTPSVAVESEAPSHTTISEEDQAPAKATTPKIEDQTTLAPVSFTKPEETPSETYPSTPAQELPKPGLNELQPTDEIPPPEEQFPSGGYGQEPDYVDEDQTFGPGTCRYGGKVYVSAQQIPRDDPCDFCFCFRSDIICLQQSCPPPIHGCHEEPIQGFCCPRYECPVSMATTLNVTTTTTTTTTTLPPHFLPHAYKGAAQRKGCQIKGHTYKVGEVVRASSGPCLHCTCGGDGQMKCDPKACTPEPMLRQMIAAAVSAKRRR